MPIVARVSRWFFLIFSVIVIRFLLITPFLAHWYCPFVIVPAVALAIRGVRLIFPVGFILGIIFLASSLLLPRAFCGFICPLGAFQDLIAKVAHPIQKKRVNYQLNRRFSMLALVLLIIIFLGAILTRSVFCLRFCPVIWSFVSFSSIPPVITIVALVIFLLVSIFYRRGFCRYLCPYGFLLSLPAESAIFKIHRNLEVCTSCRVCNNVCPMGIDIVGEGEWIESRLCISCMECISKCDKKALRLRRKK